MSCFGDSTDEKRETWEMFNFDLLLSDHRCGVCLLRGCFGLAVFNCLFFILRPLSRPKVRSDGISTSRVGLLRCRRQRGQSPTVR